VRATSQHLSSAQVADLLDERLHPGDRDAVIAHLSACAECRREVAELKSALPHVDERRPRAAWLMAGGAGLAAAALVAFAVAPRYMDRRVLTADIPSATRTAAESSRVESAARISVVEPTALSRGAAFTWKSVGVEASYKLTVQDAAGTVLWATTVADTTASLPANVTLTPGTSYFWSVDARLSDGSSARSGAHSFTAR
jgi:anti-sigma factor RsiW